MYSNSLALDGIAVYASPQVPHVLQEAKIVMRRLTEAVVYMHDNGEC